MSKRKIGPPDDPHETTKHRPLLIHGGISGGPGGEEAPLHRRLATTFAALAAAVFAAAGARADMSSPEAPYRLRSARTMATAGAPQSAVNWSAALDLSAPLKDRAEWDREPPAASTEVRELPPAPDSHTLVLSAFVSMGAWRLLRTARHWQIAALPDWYHAEGPAQIGHAVAYDFQLFALPLCFPDDLSTGGGASYRIRPASIRVAVPLWCATIVDPRGPPRAS